MKTRHQQLRGFTLIEVLISLIVAVIGIMAILQLQGVFLGVSSEAQKRSAATTVAERQIEALRNFKDKLDYQTIGAVSSAAPQSISYENYNFSLWQDVTAYNITSGSTTALSSAVASLSDYKEITVYVTWDTAAEAVELSTIIGAINPGIDVTEDTSSFGGSIPRRIHNPGLAPDVIAVDVGDGKKKETSKPLPTVAQQGQKGESVVVDFEVVTYDSLNQVERIDDFVTAACICKLNTTGGAQGLPPAQIVYNPGTQLLEDKYPLPQSGLIAKTSGTVDTTYDPSQPNICIECCRDHHDKSTNLNDISSNYRWYWPASTSHFSMALDYDHKHYWSDDGVTFTEAKNNNSRYREICRFKRMDGLYRLVKDWKLMDLTVMPSGFLASGAQGNTDYSAYVSEYVEALVAAHDLTDKTAVSLAKPSGRDLTGAASVAVGSSTQIQARGIFVEDVRLSTDLTSSAVVSIDGLRTTSGGVWLDKVPFYEINLALLANWKSASTAKVTVKNDPVTTITDTNLNYYGVYFRGLATAVSTGITTVTASSAITNTGVVGHRRADVSNPIDPNGISVSTDSVFDGVSSNVLSDTITVEVTGTVAGQVNMSGVFACIRSDGVSPCNGTNQVNMALVSISKSSGGSCAITGSGNLNNYKWTCNGLPASGSSNFNSSAAYAFSVTDRTGAAKPLFVSASSWTNGGTILIVIP